MHSKTWRNGIKAFHGVSIDFEFDLVSDNVPKSQSVDDYIFKHDSYQSASTIPCAKHPSARITIFKIQDDVSHKSDIVVRVTRLKAFYANPALGSFQKEDCPSRYWVVVIMGRAGSAYHFAARILW